MTKRGFRGPELFEHLADWDSTGDAVAIDSTTNFFAFEIVDAKNGIAAKILIEAFVLRRVAKRVNKYRHKISRGCNNLFVSERTAREITTSRSAWVLSEM